MRKLLRWENYKSLSDEELRILLMNRMRSGPTDRLQLLKFALSLDPPITENEFDGISSDLPVDSFDLNIKAED